MKINGKVYPMWEQFVEKKNEFIGGILEDFGDSLDRTLMDAEEETHHTEITDIELRPNGKDSAFFEIIGKDFGCGFDVAHGGITAGEKDWITFSGYGGHEFRIRKPAK
jgi:hypothetical protein